MAHVFAHPRDGGKPLVWKKMDRPNLYRYEPAGTYYLRGRFGGQPVRLCLQTDDYSTAIDKLEHERAKLKSRQKAVGKQAPDCLSVAIAEIAALVEADPSLREPTKDAYRRSLKRMEPGAKYAPPKGPIGLVTPKAMAEWWQRVANDYAPNQANAMLRFVRMAVKRMRKALPFISDPTEDLKRVRRPRTRLELLTREEFAKVVAHLRRLRPGPGREAADYVEFMAYSGLRPKELAHIEWRDVHLAAGAMEVWGGPDRTKNGEMRVVPITPPLRALIIQMQAKATGPGTIFKNKQPRGALKTACETCNVKHQRIYNLRHLFATVCAEVGVPVSTFAEWMGHKDGGKLALSTYVQHRDEHRDLMAAKVMFG